MSSAMARTPCRSLRKGNRPREKESKPFHRWITIPLSAPDRPRSPLSRPIRPLGAVPQRPEARHRGASWAKRATAKASFSTRRGDSRVWPPMRRRHRRNAEPGARLPRLLRSERPGAGGGCDAIWQRPNPRRVAAERVNRSKRGPLTKEGRRAAALPVPPWRQATDPRTPQDPAFGPQANRR